MATQSDENATERKTVGYVRAVADTHTAADQRDRILGYADRNLGLDPSETSILTDEGIETRANESSGYQTMLDRIAEGAVERIIITDASRVAKTIADFNEFVETALDAGMSLHVLDSDLRLGEQETGSEGGPERIGDDAVLQGLSIAAVIESSVSAERTREGISAAKASGKHVGRPPYGFNSENGQLIPNDDFNTALLVIERLRDGKSKRSTAQIAGITRTTVQNIIDRSALYEKYVN